MSEITPNCYTLRFPRKDALGKVRITREAKHRPAGSRRGDGLPDARIPTARIERLIASRPKFQPNRRGWARFYRWQDWHGRRLSLAAEMCGWRSSPSPVAAEGKTE